MPAGPEHGRCWRCWRCGGRGESGEAAAFGNRSEIALGPVNEIGNLCVAFKAFRAVPDQLHVVNGFAECEGRSSRSVVNEIDKFLLNVDVDIHITLDAACRLSSHLPKPPNFHPSRVVPDVIQKAPPNSIPIILPHRVFEWASWRVRPYNQPCCRAVAHRLEGNIICSTPVLHGVLLGGSGRKNSDFGNYVKRVCPALKESRSSSI
jgi:hypothetical protein